MDLAIVFRLDVIRLAGTGSFRSRVGNKLTAFYIGSRSSPVNGTALDPGRA